MTKIELIGEILKICDEKEKLEVDNEILRKKLDEYESTKSCSKSEEDEDNFDLKTKLMLANLIIDDEIKKIHKSTTESNTLYHDGNALENYPRYYPYYEKGMTFGKWMSDVDWDSINSSDIGSILKKRFSIDEVKQLYFVAYREVFNFLKKEAEEEENDNDNAE